MKPAWNVLERFPLPSKLKVILRNLIHQFGLELHKAGTVDQLEQRLKLQTRLDFDTYEFLPSMDSKIFLKCLALSKSQYSQELFALSELDFKREGFFVEIGATNGISFSNTYMLEREFEWRGILAEPAKCWHQDLDRNRNCSIEKKCVYSSSGLELVFNETPARMLSTIDSFSESDSWASSRSQGRKYLVETISLNDLLSKYDAPSSIDYLSIDTEGSEFEILRTLDFKLYNFKVITCEHNNSGNREKIHKLLMDNGYKRKFNDLPFAEDWYVQNVG
jgi:FkbM family methyltransferase